MLRLALRAGVIALASLALAPSLVGQAPIRVVVLDSSRISQCLGNNVHFFSMFFDQIRAALASPANFGPSGVVNRPIQLTEVAQFNESTLASADVVLAVAAGVPLEPGELMLINSFVRAGGGLLIAENRASTSIADMVGATEQASGTPGTPTISNASSPMVNGPFGTAGSVGLGISRGFGGSFVDLGPLGTEAISLAGESFAATFVVGSGRMAAISDEEVFVSFGFNGCASAELNPTNETLFLNSMAWVAPAPGFSFGVSDVEFTAYGSNCPNPIEIGPFLTALGQPVGGGVLTFRVYEGAAGSAGVLLLGTQSTQLPLLGCELLVGQIFASVSVLLGPDFNRPREGVRLSVNLPAVIGGTLYSQAWVLDPMSSSGFTTTQGAEVRF
ncbi:MAG: hypothetical protein AAF196_07470 [Planctomycetota bacterium]